MFSLAPMDKRSEKDIPKNYKFKELRVYSSTEWLADNKKKYRQVFDRYETSYVYAEFSFYNKLFDREVWEIDVKLKCYSIKKNKKEICSLSFKKKVSKYDSIVYIREGWGNKKDGAFWKKGTFYWEAWVDEVKVATKYFYIEDLDSHDGDGMYISLESVKLYEGQYDDVNVDDRTYMTEFGNEETRYIYSEIVLRNKLTVDWHCEVFVKFYNEAKELKGQVNRLQNIEGGDETITLSAGWGSNVKGSWRLGRYTVEIIFMDTLVAVVPFYVGDDFTEGNPIIRLPNGETTQSLENNVHLNKTFEELLAELDILVGLSEIKQQVRDHAQYIQFLKLRKSKGFEEKEDLSIHSVFSGNPGTGKTTVAQMMGALYKKMGLLSKGHVHEVDRVDLVGEYIGQTAPKVKAALEKARGGVLFIDEAYALARSNDDSKDFGREVIELLVKEMSNGIGDLAVIVAGYPKEMKHFIESNPGLRSRFKTFFDFKDYLPQELMEIAGYASKEKEVQLTEDARFKINEIIVAEFRGRDKSFGNARFVFDLIEETKVYMGLRLMAKKNTESLDVDILSMILGEDVDKIRSKKLSQLPRIPIDYKLLDQAIEELDTLIGIDKVKEEIHDLVSIVRYYIEDGKDVLNKFYLHTLFIGNPGTGKTTVARILANIYKALGILERGHMVETDRQGLVAGFVGQTAIKTAERIDEASGGVLFIDEAYALSNFNGLQGDYGNEAIQTILKRMEDSRGEFFVFAAGYPDNMEVFLKANPGLRSRFDKVLIFNDYSPAELLDISQSMIKQEGYKISAKGAKVLKMAVADLHEKRDKYFGNARTIRKIVLEAIKEQNLRIAQESLEGKPKSKRTSTTISDIDVSNVLNKKQSEAYKRRSIGFGE